jgi:uridine kinase
MIFVFIGGASASGKTTLCRFLLQKCAKANISVLEISMDDYYRERPEGIDPEEFRATTNFDTPNMLHLDLLKDHLIELGKGNSVSKPIFDFIPNRRNGTEIIQPTDIILIEGIFAEYFYKKYFPQELSSLTVNIATDRYKEIIEKRIMRDVVERERKPADVLKQEYQYVGPGFFKYTASAANISDVYILNKYQANQTERCKAIEASAQEVLDVLNKKRDELALGIKATKTIPNAQAIIAKSHMKAKTTLFDDEKKIFTGSFNGVLGDFKGECIQEFSL